jgi:hypothetical protein
MARIRNPTSVCMQFGDAYGVQHHGKDSPQAIQSVALPFLYLHGIISGKTTRLRWPIDRALRRRGIFHKLDPPALGSALTIRHLLPGGGVVTLITLSQYVISVYEAWQRCVKGKPFWFSVVDPDGHRYMFIEPVGNR